MKIHLQTKRGLNTLKFGAYSEILTLILRENGNPGNNYSYLLLRCITYQPIRKVYFLFLSKQYSTFMER